MTRKNENGSARLEDVLFRIGRIEDCIYRADDSLLVRLTRLEDKFDRFERDQVKRMDADKEELMSGLLTKLNDKYDNQLHEMRRNSNIALVGLVVTVTLTIVGGIFAKALGWI